MEKEDDGGMIGANLKGMVVMCVVMMLMMFAVHCTWVTSNAYSSPSVVLASTNYDGWEGALYYQQRSRNVKVESAWGHLGASTISS